MRPSGWWWGEGWGWGAGAGGGGSGQCRQLTGEAVDRWSLWSVGGFGAAAVCDQTDWQMVSYVSLLRLPSPLQMCLCFGPWLCPDVEESSGSWAQTLLRNAGTPWCCSRTTWVWPGQGSALFGTMWLWQVKKKWLKMKRLQLETWSAGQIGASVCFTCSSSSSSRICYQNILEGGGVVQKLSARWGGTNTRRHWWIISQESIRNQKQKAEHGHWPAHWSYTARVMLSYTCLIGQQAMISYVLISNLELSISYQGDDQRKSCILLQDLGTKTWIQN